QRAAAVERQRLRAGVVAVYVKVHVPGVGAGLHVVRGGLVRGTQAVVHGERARLVEGGRVGRVEGQRRHGGVRRQVRRHHRRGGGLGRALRGDQVQVGQRAGVEAVAGGAVGIDLQRVVVLGDHVAGRVLWNAPARV